MRENTLKAGFKIIIATIGFLLYSLLIVYPYWEKNASFRMTFGIWKGPEAQIIYALLFYTAFWLYLRALFCHIVFVRYIRWLMYPVCFAVVFAGVHGLLLIRDLPVVIGIVTITVPVGIVGLIFVFFWGIKQDIKVKFLSEKTLQEKIEFNKQFLNILIYGVLPCLMISFAAYSIYVDARTGNTETASIQDEAAFQKQAETPEKTEPAVKTKKTEIRGFSFSNGCDYFTGVMREASERVEIGAEDSLEQIAKAYENEFKKEDVYGKIELHGIEPDYAEFHLWQKGVVWLIFRFEKKGVCLPDSQNCSFSLLYGKDPCTQYAAVKTKKP